MPGTQKETKVSDRFYKGDKVRVSRDATYHVKEAARKAKKTYLVGKVLTDEDPCCGCYIVEFTRDIGKKGSYSWAGGKLGHMDEITPEFMTLSKSKGARVEVEDAGKPSGLKTTDFKEGDKVIVVARDEDNYPGLKLGEEGEVKTVGRLTLGIEFERQTEERHTLGGRADYGHGYWVDPGLLKVTKQVFEAGKAVKVDLLKNVRTQVGETKYATTGLYGRMFVDGYDRKMVVIPFGRTREGYENSLFFEVDDPRIVVRNNVD